MEQQAGSKLRKEYVKAVYYLKYAEYIMGNAGLNEARLLESRLESRLPGEISITSDSLVAQMVKRLPAMWETWVQSLGWEDLREKEMATYSSTLA